MTRRLACLLLAASCVAPGLALAQERRRGDGPPPSTYDLAAERTITATAADSFVMEQGDRARILKVTVEGRSLHLILGPDRYLKSQGFEAPAGTSLSVTGLPGARVNSEPAMLVRELTIGDKTITLRDKTGKGAWQQ